MADFYQVKVDVSLPRAIREVETLVNGEKLYETEGRNYAAGSFVNAADITPPLREKAENGELDHLLTAVDQPPADTEPGAVIAEHEAEAQVFIEDGKKVLNKEEVLNLLSAADTPESDDPKPRPRPSSPPKAEATKSSKGSKE